MLQYHVDKQDILTGAIGTRLFMGCLVVATVVKGHHEHSNFSKGKSHIHSNKALSPSSAAPFGAILFHITTVENQILSLLESCSKGENSHV